MRKNYLLFMMTLMVAQGCMPKAKHSSTAGANSTGPISSTIIENSGNWGSGTPTPTVTATATITATAVPTIGVTNAANEYLDPGQLPAFNLDDITKLKKKTGNAGAKVILYPQGYIAAGCENASNFNFCITVYDKSMNVTRVISNGPKIPNNSYQTDFTAVTDIAYASTGHIIIAGFTSQPLGEMPADTGGPLTARGDGFVAKYTIDGQYSWLKHFGAQTKGAQASMREEFHSVAVNSTGEIIVAGTTASNFADTHAGKSDALLIKLSPSGQILFQKQLGISAYGALANKEEKFVSVVIDSSDNIFVGGHTNGNLLETNSAMPNCGFPGAANGECEWSDILVFSYTKAGALRWGRQLGKVSATGLSAASAKFDFISQIVLGADGAVYFTGSREVYNDIVVGKVNPSGTLAWYRKYLGANNQKPDSGVAILADTTSDSLYVCGTTMGNFYEAQGGGAVSSSSQSSGDGDIVLLKITAGTGALGPVRHFGNVSLGPDKSNKSEFCGRIYKEGDYLTLFGSSESNLFSGPGKQFIARDLEENFVQLLIN